MREIDDKSVLKVRPKRSLYLEQHPSLGVWLVKRFHAPNAWQSALDRWRASREARALSRWAALGLPVPQPAQVRLRDGFWELLMPHIAGANSLLSLLHGEAEWPVSKPDIATSTGKLLARLDRAGLRHGDLHAGNLLFDALGNPWLVDPTAEPLFSRRGRPTRGRWIRLCAALRELENPSFRRRILLAYAAHGGPAPLPTNAAQWQTLEAEARLHRFRVAKKRDARWLRESGATELRDNVRWARNRIPGELRVSPPLPLEQAQSQWLCYGRLIETQIPCLAPEALHLGPPARLHARIPFGASPLRGDPPPRALGKLLGLLHDRGFALDSIQATALWISAEEDLWLDPEAWQGPGPEAIPWDRPHLPALALGLRKRPPEWERFVRAFCQAQNATPDRKRLLKAALHCG